MPGAAQFDQRLAGVWDRSNLSLSQWLLWHEVRRQAPYFLSPLAISFTFATEIDTRRFRQAFQAVVDGSDALRTVFVVEDGVPQRYVLPRLPLAMDVVDLSAAYQPLSAYEQWRLERDLRPLSPTSKLFDSTLVRLGDQHYVWRLALHRLIADSYSLLLIYRRTAEAYTAAGTENGAAPGATSHTLPDPIPFTAYAEIERKLVGEHAPLDALAAAAPQRLARPMPVAGEQFSFDLGSERTARLRQLAATLACDGLFGRAGAFALCATALTALIAGMRKCRSVCIDTEYDLRPQGPWTHTIGRICRSHAISVTAQSVDSLPLLLRQVGETFAQARREVQIAPIGERPAAFCRVLLLVDDLTFGPFGETPVKIERLDTCYSRRKPRATRESRIEPLICLALDSYASPDNLRATFTCCGSLAQSRAHQLGREYIRRLDAVLDACARDPASSL
jgi:hypothetical protein